MSELIVEIGEEGVMYKSETPFMTPQKTSVMPHDSCSDPVARLIESYRWKGCMIHKKETSAHLSCLHISFLSSLDLDQMPFA